MAAILEWFAIPVDHVLSELSIMTRLSWVALRGMFHSFTELRKHLHHNAVHIMHMLGWMNYKLKSRLLGEISTTLGNGDDTTLMAESEEELKSLLIRVKEEGEKKA